MTIYLNLMMFGMAGGQSIGWVDKDYNMGELVSSALEFILCDTVYYVELEIFMKGKSVEDVFAR